MQRRTMPELTDREKLILHYLVKGTPDTVIARQIGIGRTTMRKAVSRLIIKLGVANRTQVAVWAWQHGYGFRTMYREAAE